MMNHSHKLIVVVPYRDRAQNLAQLLPTLSRHLADVPHRIVVVEQAGDEVFNKGRILNTGFLLHRGEADYFCFHDVDLLPETADCDYSWAEGPTHLSRYCSQFDYEIPYAWACGGVLLVPRTDVERVNGYSNEYWGWGAEDDDLAMRFAYFGISVRHRAGRYTSLPHELGWNQRKLPSAFRRNMERLRSQYDYLEDGLSSVAFRVVETTDRGTHLHHLVDVGAGPREEVERHREQDFRPTAVDPIEFWNQRHRTSLAFSIVRHALSQRAAGRPVLPPRTVPQAVLAPFADD